MKQLERICLVQYHFYEKEDIRVADITGLFGANGCGKSSCFDAIQTVMLGASKSRVALNAQADDATNRSIRSYCLGQYAGGESRLREVANTYITLVWSDAKTGRKVSTGVAIYASASDADHKVLGCYVAPDVDLALVDHLEIIAGVERPRDWKAFRLALQERSERITGERDIIFSEGTPFQRALLDALRGSGGAPAPEAFTRAFRFALRMRFKDPIDHIVRRDILEPRRIEIDKFRRIAKTFSDLSKRVQEVSDRIDAGKRIAAQYIEATQAHIHGVTWRVLQKRVAAAKATEVGEAAQEAVDTAKDAFEKSKAESTQADNLVESLEQEIAEKETAVANHSAHSTLAGAQQNYAVAERTFTLRAQAAADLLGDSEKVLRSASKADDLASLAEQLVKAADGAKAAAASVRDLDAATVVPIWQSVTAASRTAANLLLNGPIREANRVADEIGRKIKLQEEDVERASLGKAPLSEAANGLQRALVASGITAIPVCELTSVSDRTWQPVIEGYLGRNAEALLVDADQEAKAFRVYRSLDTRNKLFGVKIAQSSKQSPGAVPRTNSVAALIEGSNPLAVAFLRRQFGDLICADNDDEALAGGATLTRDGMLVRADGFERIRPRREAELQIGPQPKSRLGDLQKQLIVLRAEAERAGQRVANLNTFMDTFVQLSGDGQLKSLKHMINAMGEARAACEAAKSALSNSAAADYIKLVDELSEANRKLPGARKAASEALSSAVRAEEKLKQATDARRVAYEALDAARSAADRAEEHPDFDPTFAGEGWDRLLSRCDTDFAEMHISCDRLAQDCESRVTRITNRASSDLGEFVVSYQATVAPEIRADWRLCQQWLANEIERLERTELHQYRELAAQAASDAADAFRMDVATRLSDHLDSLENQINRLNTALSRCPSFSNGERYSFVMLKREQYSSLRKFVKDIAVHGPQVDLLEGAGPMPPEFEALLNDRVSTGTGAIPSPLEDYREFYDFDVAIHREDKLTGDKTKIGFLSDRLGTASGGEHRAPLYVIAGAALASAYRMPLDGTPHDGVRLIMLDEAFDKMDATNLIATMLYLENLGLQILLASPGENKVLLEAFMHRYYDVQRDSNYNVRMDGHDVSATARELLRSDLAEFHPELIERQINIAREVSQAA